MNILGKLVDSLPKKDNRGTKEQPKEVNNKEFDFQVNEMKMMIYVLNL